MFIEPKTIMECKKCGGQVFEEVDEYGIYYDCLQCSAQYYRRNNLIQTQPMVELQPMMVRVEQGVLIK